MPQDTSDKRPPAYSTVAGSGSYRIEPLNADNWLAWKRKITAILRDLDLESLLTEGPPQAKVAASPTDAERKAIDEWKKKDSRARTRIELAVGDSEMIHLLGATTAKEMWDQLKTVKEVRGKLGILAARRALFRAAADDDFNMSTHVTKLKLMQEQLHLMGSKVPDEDFAMILLTSLPEAWDSFTSAYLGSQGNETTVTSANLIAQLLEEERRRNSRNGGSGSGGTTLQAKETRECHNCKKKGHLAKDCWAKGGGKEGQGPKKRKGKGDRAAQTQETDDPAAGSSYDIAYMATPTDFSKYDWLLDCASSTHLCTTRDAFIDYTPLQNSSLKGVGPVDAPILGKGTVLLKFRVGGKTITHRLLDVKHVPSAPNCLMSQGRFIEEGGGSVDCHGKKCYLKNKSGHAVGDGNLIARMYLLNARAVLRVNDSAFVARVPKYSWDEWHRRYGHLAISGIQRAVRENMVTGLEIDKSTIPSRTCASCLEGKMPTKPFPKEAEHRSTTPGGRTMTDVWGPAASESISHFKYFISFTDDATRMCHVLFMKAKSEAFDRITTYLNHIEKQYGMVPKRIRLDNGKELVNEKLKKLVNEKGMTLEPSAPYSPSQNGVAERFNRTLLEMGNTMLFAAKLPPRLWEFSISHAVYVRNRSPTHALSGKTPYEAWFGKKPDVSHFREFGCDVWVKDEQRSSKLQPKAKKGKFLGFVDGSGSIRYLDGSNSVKVSRTFAFHESVPLATVPGLRAEGETGGVSQPNAENAAPNPTEQSPDQQSDQTPTSPDKLVIRIPPRSPDKASTTTTTTTVTPNIQARPVRSTRKDVDYKLLGNPDARKPADRANHITDHAYQISDLLDVAFAASSEDGPKNLEEAMESEEREEWVKAMNEELGMLEKMETWRMEDLPEGRKAVGSKWVFLRKLDEQGNTVRFKARLVAQGFSQKPGLDYDDLNTFAPVVRYESLRAMLAMTAQYGWYLNQYDVKNAYLNGTLNEEIYMRPPPGFNDGTNRVCRLQKSIYGLKQAGNVWNNTLTNALTDLSYRQIKSDYGVYVRQKGDKFSILLVWVDDIIAISNLETEADQITIDLSGKFEIKTLGTPKFLLGIRIDYNREKRVLALSQAHYIDQVLTEMGLEDCKPVATPLDSNVNLDYEEGEDQEERSDQASYAYSALIGKLLRLALIMRVDIMFPAQRLGQFTRNPRPRHWTAVKRVFRYLKGTKEHKLWYEGKKDRKEEGMVIYCDADWASQASRKSTSGYVITLAGGAIAWNSKKQGVIALSTAEAEYVAAAHVVKQVLWYQALLTELGLEPSRAPTVLSDNQAAIAIAHHPEFHARTKHIDISLHFVRDHIRSGRLSIRYVRSEDNLADLFTKGLPRGQHEKLTKKMGLEADPRGSVGNDGPEDGTDG